jgi:alkylation response protein AidB-like acyl-CoA dehydrogenase
MPVRPRQPATRAERDGDEFVVNGQKVWTSAASTPTGGSCWRAPIRRPEASGDHLFLVNMHSPGVEVRPLKQISGSSEFCEVFFDNVRVSADNVVGEMNRGWQIAQTTLSMSAAAIC